MTRDQIVQGQRIVCVKAAPNQLYDPGRVGETAIIEHVGTVAVGTLRMPERGPKFCRSARFDDLERHWEVAS